LCDDSSRNDVPLLLAGTRSTPSTWRSTSMSRYWASSLSDSSVLQNITLKPRAPAASSTPRAMVVKKGFMMSERTSASILVRFDRSCRPSAFGT
jgi:hypothetical protein